MAPPTNAPPATGHITRQQSARALPSTDGAWRWSRQGNTRRRPPQRSLLANPCEDGSPAGLPTPGDLPGGTSPRGRSPHDDGTPPTGGSRGGTPQTSGSPREGGTPQKSSSPPGGGLLTILGGYFPHPPKSWAPASTQRSSVTLPTLTWQITPPPRVSRRRWKRTLPPSTGNLPTTCATMGEPPHRSTCPTGSSARPDAASNLQVIAGRNVTPLCAAIVHPTLPITSPGRYNPLDDASPPPPQRRR